MSYLNKEFIGIGNIKIRIYSHYPFNGYDNALLTYGNTLLTIFNDKFTFPFIKEMNMNYHTTHENIINILFI